MDTTYSLTKDYWNNRYLNNDFGWDLGGISPPLKEYIEQIQNKELVILIPGAGNAHEAEFLWRSGFKNIYILDVAEVPLQNIAKRLPDFPKNQLIQQDFFDHKGKYDLIIEQTFFCAIHPSLRGLYAKQMVALLKPTGKLIGLLFNDLLNVDKPPFGGFKEDYKVLFEPFFYIKIMETAYNSVLPRADRELFICMEPKK